MDFFGGLCYTNGRAANALAGTRRASPIGVSPTNEVPMKLMDHPSPETSPDGEGSNRGITAIPGAGIEPARSFDQGILREMGAESTPVPISPDRVKTEPTVGPNLSRCGPKKARVSPEMSPGPTLGRTADGLRHDLLATRDEIIRQIGYRTEAA